MSWGSSTSWLADLHTVMPGNLSLLQQGAVPTLRSSSSTSSSSSHSKCQVRGRLWQLSTDGFHSTTTSAVNSSSSTRDHQTATAAAAAMLMFNIQQHPGPLAGWIALYAVQMLCAADSVRPGNHTPCSSSSSRQHPALSSSILSAACWPPLLADRLLPITRVRNTKGAVTQQRAEPHSSRRQQRSTSSSARRPMQQ